MASCGRSGEFGVVVSSSSVCVTSRCAWNRPGAVLAERLLCALEAGEAAGGEAGDVPSAGLRVVAGLTWPVLDLRVDWHPKPIAELRNIWSVYAPQMPDYVTRTSNPAAAPSYGVPGDP